jgi:polysaccharide biosynthesis protein PelF
VKEWFGKIDVLALTSISEAQPLALLEAGCAGLPAVTTDVGSCREILEGLPADGVPGRCGFVVPSCDPDAVADALAEILLNPAMRASMSDVFRKRVVSYYGKPRIDRAYRELYDSLFPPEGKRP